MVYCGKRIKQAQKDEQSNNGELTQEFKETIERNIWWLLERGKVDRPQAIKLARRAGYQALAERLAFMGRPTGVKPVSIGDAVKKSTKKSASKPRPQSVKVRSFAELKPAMSA